MKANSIRNYTSSVPAERSIANIEKKLIEYGATDIMKQYEGGKIKGICFRINFNNQALAFKLPCKAEPVYRLLMQASKEEYDKMDSKYRSKNPYRIEKYAEGNMLQAERTAWKNIYEWVHLQMTMIQLEQVEFAEVFLPFMMVNGSDTVFKKLSDNNFKALTS